MASWRELEAVLTHLRALLGHSRGALGLILGHLGRAWGHFRLAGGSTFNVFPLVFQCFLQHHIFESRWSS